MSIRSIKQSPYTSSMMEEDDVQAMPSGTSSKASSPDDVQQQEKSGTEKRSLTSATMTLIENPSVHLNCASLV